mmetsp:Transcript_55787/g.100247  ORF Transcript_55787/g.100247 Transcript_55787/m.100247 type:complete len:213 (-) Transcript_55787:160-798(-)|eukprot:CAMPEP_0115103680 /NCGR_PEP_ID=MMETSP0227-20121206/34770_1 /TAXON_ID=89957 /ORGANISM="Polarella glacialis, Strain CCMP 1383" /LENGTH=212 /DNA_ID=CAMNT_0002500265 /DNA_START=59 /DNA_END=697 /DNA_ORIENTATION=+
MPVGEHMNPAHQFWQQRVDKERKSNNKHLVKLLGKKGMSASLEAAGLQNSSSAASLQDLHRSLSTPALGRGRGREGGAEGGSTMLPQIDENRGPSRLMTGLSSSALRRLDTSFEDSEGFRPRTGGTVCSGVQPSLRSATASRHQLRSNHGGSEWGSMRSSITGLTTASLRREVAEAVQAEVAKVVQPLKDKLQSEQMTRQRLEEMLQAVGAG